MSVSQDIHIIAETAQYIVICKPAGLLVEHSPYYPSVEDLIRAYLQEKFAKKEPFVGIVHRLDRLVSGVLIVATRKSSLKAFNEQFSSRQVRKIYTALVENHPPQKKDTLKQWLVIDKEARRAHIVPNRQKGALEVSLSYEVIDQKAQRSLLKIDLHTGKFHQIRAQLSSIGCPIVGDEKYGSTAVLFQDAIALHATTLELNDPLSRERLEFNSPFPYIL
jgi:23S rRNA pseudouridine1911/1915/1917 synthase